MASPHSPAHDDDDLTAPHGITTTIAAQTTAHPADISRPPSPDTYAAAIALATFSDSRPPSSHDEDVDDMIDDDDYSGGISLADFQHFMDTPISNTHSMQDEDEPATAPVQSLMASIHSWPQNAMTSTLELYNPPIPYHVSSVHVPVPPIPLSHLSSSDHSLEPPPTLQEAHLSIQDKGSFAPITSFFHWFTPDHPVVPGLDLVQVPRSILQDDLQGDSYDFQGIDWAIRNTTRSIMRSKRVEYESEKLLRNQKEIRKRIPPTPRTDNSFQFRRNNTAHRAFFPHFQLRNVLAATSQHDIYYAAGHRVFRTDAEGTPADIVVDLSKRLAPDGSITTIATQDNVLVAGAFEGEYAITDLSSTYGTPCTFGRTTDFAADTKSKIVNHMHLFESRQTYTPQAVLCSNDYRLRVLDCATNTFTHSSQYSAAVNCAATSPNGRMRVVVGDFQETLVINAETGQIFESLKSHSDDAFACAWADDGIHIATAAQDSTIVVWDARYWAKPLKEMASELSVPRSLRFSPIGSGPRVLIAAEADDFVNVINAQTFESKQVFDFFGPIGGATLTPDGQSLYIANGERRFGGIVELKRTGWTEKTSSRKPWQNTDWDNVMTDWAHDSRLDDHDRVLSSHLQRQRRHVDFSQLIV